MITSSLQKKIDQSIRLLHQVQQAHPDEVIEIAYSGGKDSDVILQLAKEAGIRYEAIYKNTTIDPPGTIRHAQEMGATIIRPKRTFGELIQNKGLPSRFARFCCQELKEYKVRDVAVIGVRRSESKKRAEAGCAHGDAARDHSRFLEVVRQIHLRLREDRHTRKRCGVLPLNTSIKNKMNTFKKIAEQRAAQHGMTNRGRTKAYVRGFEDAIAYLKELQDKGLLTIKF